MENNHPNIKEETDFNDIPSKSIDKEEVEKIIEQLTEPLVDNKEQLAEALTDDVEKLTEPVIDTLDCEFVNDLIKVDIIKEWEKKFTIEIKEKSKSKKVKYTLADALSNTTEHTKRDECFVLAYHFLNENPPERNDYIKYINAFYESGKKLKEKYFKFDLVVLNKYYTKMDEKKKNGVTYNRFNITSYRNYVIYMILKLHNEYIESDDELFNIKKGDREYNPITKLPSVLRGFLPINIKEYDIIRLYPTIIDEELGTDYRHGIYEILSKTEFAMALNANSLEPDDDYYFNSIEKLEKVYGSSVYKVLTRERFSEKGRVFKDFTKREKEIIMQFVLANNLLNYVRLHDAIFVLDSQTVTQTKFGLFEFKCKKTITQTPNPDAVEPFYFLNEKGKVKILPTGIRDCLVSNGFIRISTLDDQIFLIKCNNNIIDPYNHRTDLLVSLKNEINEVGGYYKTVENVLAHEYRNTVMKALPLIEPYELKFYKDTRHSFGLLFENGFFVMDIDGKIVNKKSDPKNGFFLKHTIQSHKFEYTEDVGDFEQFIKNVSGEKFRAFMTMIGYLVHSYKDPTFSPCIILTDEGADDINRDGGRGKTFVIVALSQVLTLLRKGGLEFDPNYTHVFADLERGTQLYAIDDVPAGFNYEALYTNILGDISCQRKGKKAEAIEFRETPKFIITSNWVIKYSSANASTNRRFVEFKFEKFYTKEHTPIDDFGRRFFEDWDADEFNRFYSYIFRCVHLFFTEGLIQPKYDKELDTFLVKFRNDAFITEFERILKPLLLTKKKFTVTDFLREYNHFDNPFRNEKWFHQNNVRDLIDTWLNQYNSIYKYWGYSKSNRSWVLNNANTKPIIDIKAFNKVIN